MVELPARAPLGAIAWTALAALLAGAGLTITDPAIRVGALRGILLLAALGEGLGGFFQVFRARQMTGLTGRPYDPGYHGVVQDFGFYNFAIALLFGLAALDPSENRVAVGVGISLYAVHGVTHILRYLGFYFGGETPVPTRPREMELRDGMPVLAAGTGMLFFFP